MKHVLLLLTLLMAFGFAHADSNPYKSGESPIIEASTTIDDQTNCASPDGALSADNLLADTKNAAKSARKAKLVETPV